MRKNFYIQHFVSGYKFISLLVFIQDFNSSLIFFSIDTNIFGLGIIWMFLAFFFLLLPIFFPQRFPEGNNKSMFCCFFFLVKGVP